jgi:hypothetical protein
MMIRQLPSDTFDTVELVPRAVVALPLSYFAKRFQFKIIESHDDLDHYEAAALSLNGDLQFGLKHYRGHPVNQTTVYLPMQINRALEIASWFSQIAKELELSRESIIWQQSTDDPEPLFAIR